jgi:hypothetical protein
MSAQEIKGSFTLHVIPDLKIQRIDEATGENTWCITMETVGINKQLF